MTTNPDMSAVRARLAARRARALEALAHTALAHLHDPDLLDELLERVQAVMDADNAAILLLDEDGQHLTMYSVRGPEKAVAEQVRIPVGRGVAGRIVASRAPLVVDDLTTVEVANPFLREHLRSLVGVPLLVGDRVLGALHVDSIQPHHFTEDDAQLLQMIAEPIALALDHARLLRDTERQRHEAEAARREAETRTHELTAMVDAMADGVLLYDRDGRIIRANEAARSLMGYDHQPDCYEKPVVARADAYILRDAKGRTIAEEDLPPKRVLRGEVLNGIAAEDYAVRTLDGREVLLNLSGAPIRNGDGQISGAVIIARDVSERRRLEERLRFQGSMLERTHDAIFMWVLGGPIIFWNRGAELLYGYGAAAALGRSSHELLQSRLPEPAPEFEARLAREGEWTGELTHTARDGSVVEVLSRQQVLREGDGRTYVFETAHDITERKRLERRTRETLEGLLAIAEALVQPAGGGEEAAVPVGWAGAEQRSAMAQRLAELTCNVLGCGRVGIIAVDPETQLQRAVAVVGLSPEQERQWWAEQEALAAQGVRFGEGADPEALARFIAGEALVVDMRQPPYDKLPNPYHITTSLFVPMRIGSEVVGILSLDYDGIPHDFSEEERTLASAVGKLAALVIERERLVRERAEAQASELALREAHERMNEFLHIVNHELHTPLTTLKSSVQLAQRRLIQIIAAVPAAKQTAPSNPETDATDEDERSTPVDIAQVEALRQLLERADRQTNRLDRMMSELLDASRVQTGKLELHPAECDLVALARECVEEQRQAQSQTQVQGERGICLQLPSQTAVPLKADGDRIRQVITNFLTNALKYSTADRPVEVRLGVNGDQARLAVRDEGPGVPRKEQARIWERFHRTAGVAAQSGAGVGLGLGLYISRQIIEQHGGQVGVESAVGKGSTFWFTLPLASANR